MLWLGTYLLLFNLAFLFQELFSSDLLVFDLRFDLFASEPTC